LPLTAGVWAQATAKSGALRGFSAALLSALTPKRQPSTEPSAGTKVLGPDCW